MTEIVNYLYVFWPFWHRSLWWLTNIGREKVGSIAYISTWAFVSVWAYEVARYKTNGPVTIYNQMLDLYGVLLCSTDQWCFLFLSFKSLENFMRWEESFCVIFQICGPSVAASVKGRIGGYLELFWTCSVNNAP